MALIFHARECNSLASIVFARIGVIPGTLLGVLALLPLMVAIPYLLRQNERMGLLSAVIMGAIVTYTAFDAVNDVSALIGFQHAYLLAHAVLDTTNNVTGNILGTGESLC